MKYSGIGGQAVMEGVMMQNKDTYAVAVRKPDHEIDVKVSKRKNSKTLDAVRKIPILRGVVSFVDSLYLGMSTLMYSASFFEDEDDEGTLASKKKEKEEELTAEEKKKRAPHPVCCRAGRGNICAGGRTMANFNVSLKKLTEKVSLDVVYTPKGLEEINVEIAEVNRPGLFLAGYYDYFDKLRLQILGLAEMNFLSGLSAEKRYERLDQLFGQQPPAVIVCRSEELEPFPEMLELAQKHGVALLRSNEMTCTLMGSLISVLNLELAPRITRHGVLVEVYGEGILILGDSGIGKSELAIELVKRGHRLVADDAVELRKVSNRQIMGTAPENIRHFIELRGIGIVNVARVFGVGAVKESESLDLVVQLEAWDPTKNYQRTGLESEYYEILGVNIPSTSIPVSPGRNLAVVLETAAINNRQKRMGYNAAKELLIRLGLDGTVE